MNKDFEHLLKEVQKKKVNEIEIKTHKDKITLLEFNLNNINDEKNKLINKYEQLHTTCQALTSQHNELYKNDITMKSELENYKYKIKEFTEYNNYLNNENKFISKKYNELNNEYKNRIIYIDELNKEFYNIRKEENISNYELINKQYFNEESNLNKIINKVKSFLQSFRTSYEVIQSNYQLVADNYFKNDHLNKFFNKAIDQFHNNINEEIINLSNTSHIQYEIDMENGMAKLILDKPNIYEEEQKIKQFKTPIHKKSKEQKQKLQRTSEKLNEKSQQIKPEQPTTGKKFK